MPKHSYQTFLSYPRINGRANDYWKDGLRFRRRLNQGISKKVKAFRHDTVGKTMIHRGLVPYQTDHRDITEEESENIFPRKLIKGAATGRVWRLSAISRGIEEICCRILGFSKEYKTKQLLLVEYNSASAPPRYTPLPSLLANTINSDSTRRLPLSITLIVISCLLWFSIVEIIYLPTSHISDPTHLAPVPVLQSDVLRTYQQRPLPSYQNNRATH